METSLDNSVKVYVDKQVVILLSQLVAKCPSIWESEDFVQILLERWIKVPFKPEWKVKISTIKPKIYLPGNEACQLVDETFDEMHCLGRLKLITAYIFFSFLVFIVWKTNVESKRKDREIMDIRKLNEMVLPNSYLLLL